VQAPRAILRRPEIKALFCDFVAGGVLTPQPQWNPSLARCGAFAETPSFFTADANETTLQCIADQHGDAAIARIPLPLVKRSSAGVQFTPPPRLSDPTGLPLVSAIIPTKYRMDLLEKCLTGLATKTDYPNLEIVVVDNGVTNETFMGLIEKASRSFVVRVVEDKGSFNFSRLMNTGVSASQGEVVLSLNDDVEATDKGWLHQMAGSAMQPHAGAVGARLIYPDGSIQHAGVVLGLGGTCAHLWRGLDPKTALSNPYVMSPSNRMAVTGACLAVRRSAFDRVRGFDEAFPVAYNDIDFCLRLQEAGLQNFYRGDVCLIHHEGQSRGTDDATVSKRRRQSVEAAKFFQRWADLLDKDPNFSPAFDATREIGIAHDANYAAPGDYTLSLRA
ncbi:MAG: glycosyltransferase, partial [Alphaproteobacteria bacterium]